MCNRHFCYYCGLCPTGLCFLLFSMMFWLCIGCPTSASARGNSALRRRKSSWHVDDTFGMLTTRIPRLSGLNSRAHLIRNYTYPASAAERALILLAQLYAQKGHNLAECLRVIRVKKPGLFIDIYGSIPLPWNPVQDSPISFVLIPHPIRVRRTTAFCVCQLLFLRNSTTLRNATM